MNLISVKFFPRPEPDPMGWLYQAVLYPFDATDWPAVWHQMEVASYRMPERYEE